MTESEQPPAYPTHAAIPPSSEATTAPAYTPRYPSFEEHDDTSPLRTSRSLPPSRPLQRPDRLELTNQSTTINIGQAAQTQAPETPDNTTPTPTNKSGQGDTCDGVIALFLFCFFAALLITMVYSAVFLRRDSAAFNENSRALKELKYEMSHTKETVTATLTAVIRESKATVTKGITEKVTETVTQTVNGLLSARDVWVTSYGNARG
ncbi:hypothetical protein KCU73_g5751, partial [Aureobasidium melanogenum]